MKIVSVLFIALFLMLTNQNAFAVGHGGGGEGGRGGGFEGRGGEMEGHSEGYSRPDAAAPRADDRTFDNSVRDNTDRDAYNRGYDEGASVGGYGGNGAEVNDWPAGFDVAPPNEGAPPEVPINPHPYPQ